MLMGGGRDQSMELDINHISNELVYVLNIGLVFIGVSFNIYIYIYIYIYDKGFYLINGFRNVWSFVHIYLRIWD